MSSTLNLTLPDGSRKAVPVGATLLEVARSVGRRLADDAAVELHLPSSLGSGSPIPGVSTGGFDGFSLYSPDNRGTARTAAIGAFRGGYRGNGGIPSEAAVAGIASVPDSMAFQA